MAIERGKDGRKRAKAGKKGSSKKAAAKAAPKPKRSKAKAAPKPKPKRSKAKAAPKPKAKRSKAKAAPKAKRSKAKAAPKAKRSRAKAAAKRTRRATTARKPQGKIQLAVSWAAACGGCDVSLLDIEMKLLELTALADVVYWPVAMDFKRRQLVERPDGSVDVGIFNGAVRTSEQLEDARLFRRKCKVLVAYGSCACFGGIPGLANLADRAEVLEVACSSTASTDNPEGLRPLTEWPVPASGAGEGAGGATLTLPALFDTVQSLPQAVPVDVLMPGCPPPTERILDLLGAVRRYVDTGELPPAGTVIASDKALCDECPRRESRSGSRITKIVRPHEVQADRERCFLEQGMLCMGIATRGGCGGTCLSANMPCRGCFGPTADMLDPGAEAMSAIGSLAGEANESWVQAHEMKKAIRSIRDPVGTFYRFSLPSAFLNRRTSDKPAQEPS